MPYDPKYPSGSDDTFKGIIRKKAAMFVIREGVMYFKEGRSTYAAWTISQNNSVFVLRHII